MTDEQITAAVVDILAEIADADPAQVRADSVFDTDLDVDSLLMVEILVAVEDHFSIRIPDTEARTMKTVADLVNLIQQCLVAG